MTNIRQNICDHSFFQWYSNAIKWCFPNSLDEWLQVDGQIELVRWRTECDGWTWPWKEILWEGQDFSNRAVYDSYSWPKLMPIIYSITSISISLDCSLVNLSVTFRPSRSVRHIPSVTFRPSRSVRHVPSVMFLLSRSVCHAPSVTFRPTHSVCHVLSVTFHPSRSVCHVLSVTSIE